MNVEPDTTTQRSSRAATRSSSAGDRNSGSAFSPMMADVLEPLRDRSPRYVARAPGRLDVMGALAEYTGSLVLNATIADHVCIGVQRRTDGILSMAFARSSGLDGSPPTEIPMSRLLGPDGAPIDADQGRQLVDGAGAPSLRCMLGTVVELCRARLVPPFTGGLSMVLGSTLDGLRDAGRDAALASAAAVAVARAYNAALSPSEAAALCQRVENDWLQVPVGVGDAVCVLSGESRTLTEVQSDSGTIGGSIRLPDRLSLMGIDCGVRRPDAMVKYERVRTAAFMGRALIDRIIQHEGAHDLQWDGRLARIAATDYVARFRDRLPTKLAGSEYLERFGETGDPLTRVDPTLVYKIRSRTEHHVYEHARACQFVECLSRAIRNKDERVLAKVGGLMYASHWSYGQRCGLGSVETDLLVNLIRKHASDAGVYGAKVSARGCGGVVTVLMQSTDRASAAIEEAINRYQTKSGRKATPIRGSSQGAFASGVREL